MLHFINQLFNYKSQNESNLEAQVAKLIAASQKQNTRIQMYEQMLANENAAAVQAQAIAITNHAVFRYRERINKAPNESDDRIRKLLYGLILRQLATLDKLNDGTYELSRNVVCRIRDNTMTTVHKRKGAN